MTQSTRRLRLGSKSKEYPKAAIKGGYKTKTHPKTAARNKLPIGMLKSNPFTLILPIFE